MNYIDMHSHILPQLDDGSKSMEQSLQMLRIAADEGIATIYATPHNMPGKGQPSKETVLRKIAELQAEATRCNINIRIMAGTEYYYREEVLKLLDQNQGIPLGESDCILVEFDPMAEKIYIRNGIREILSLGYTPVVAHVERYAALMEQQFEILDEVNKMGALLQVNAASVTGDNGWKTKHNVQKLLQMDLITFIGTDAHDDVCRAPCLKKCAHVLKRKYGNQFSEALLRSNAEQLL